MSPTTPDLADGSTSATFDLGEALFASDDSSITFHWRGVLADVDSVRPELILSCVVDSTSVTTTTTVAPTISAPVTVPVIAAVTTEPLGQGLEVFASTRTA
ncbi:MAG: hypothetical protein ACKVHU_10485 [Acidimicrobiales bacterium]